jgi:hypothetical protein
MPGLLVGLGMFFAFALGRSTNEHVKVTYVNEAGIQDTQNVLKPLLVVKEGDDVSVRSGFQLKGEYQRPLPKFHSDWDILDVGDFSAAEINRQKPE